MYSKALTQKNGIPSQDNWYDCGIYMLGYLHKLMADPTSFGRKLLSDGFDIESDWPDMDPKQMRGGIRQILQDIAAKQKDERVAHRAAKRAAKRAAQDGTLQSSQDVPKVQDEAASSRVAPFTNGTDIQAEDDITTAHQSSPPFVPARGSSPATGTEIPSEPTSPNRMHLVSEPDRQVFSSEAGFGPFDDDNDQVDQHAQARTQVGEAALLNQVTTVMRSQTPVHKDDGDFLAQLEKAATANPEDRRVKVTVTKSPAARTPRRQHMSRSPRGPPSGKRMSFDDSEVIVLD